MQPEQAKRAKPSSFGLKFRKISEVHEGNFADLCVQVVKAYPTNGYTELYVTDYTENKDVYHYLPPEAEGEPQREGDEYGYTDGRAKRGWPGPYGYLVLKVEAKNPHADFANREVNEGDFVLLQNVRLKSARGMGTLEGNMWPDSRNFDKILIQKIRDKQLPEMEALLERKRRYWESRNAKMPAEQPAKGESALTKKQRKKLNRALRNIADATKNQEKEKTSTKAENKAGSNTSTTLARREEVMSAVKQKLKVNPHVRCGNLEVHLSTFHDILDTAKHRHVNESPDGHTYDLPFVNAKYRVQARVVGFAPEQLEDFAIPASSIDKDDSLDESLLRTADFDSSPRYEWSFSLFLEPVDSAQVQYDPIQVVVGHEEAQYLFGNDVPDPTDLRQDKRFLAKVREKLCILWGNLEEKGEEEPVSNLPFYCCLMEYGVEVEKEEDESPGATEFERLYRMFGVTIS